jgi:hypothetical protein
LVLVDGALASPPTLQNNSGNPANLRAIVAGT